MVFIKGCGDFSVNEIVDLPDPCPLPEASKKRTLIEKEKTVYAPMSGVGGVVYDKDAVYINLGRSLCKFSPNVDLKLLNNFRW